MRKDTHMVALVERVGKVSSGVGEAIVVDIYCRVSTDPQEDNTSLDEQEAAGRAYCREHGYVVGMVHREVFSGNVYRERKKLSLMRERYQKGIVQGVVFRTYDRLARRVVHQAILLDEMEHLGVGIYCVKEKLDDTPEGKLTRAFLSLLAEWEWEKIRERTMTGRTNAVKRGEMKALSAHKMRYGFQWEDPETKEKIILAKKEAAVIRWMAIKYAQGVSSVRLRQTLKEWGIPSPMGTDWSDHTIITLLSDPRITGKNVKAFHYKEDRYKSHHETLDVPDGTWPAIISVESFERIQKRITLNKAQASRSSKCPEEFLLRAGYVRCAICKKIMRSCHDDRRGHYFYRCNDHGMVPSKQLDADIWTKVEEMADHVALIEQAIELATKDSRLESNIKAIDASIETWQATADNYLEDLKDKSLVGRSRNAIRTLMNDANEVVMKLEEEKAQLQCGLINREREREIYGEILEWCREVKEARQALTYTRKRDFLEMLGIVVMVRCEKPYSENSKYKMNVALPALQEIVEPPSDEKDDELVTSAPARRSGRPLFRQ
jgi:site-specific DNA recombinase